MALAAAGTVEVSGLPAPSSGQQWVSWHDVAVQVPVAWDYGSEPSDQWCVDGGVGRQHPLPYVALDPTYGFHTAVGCTDAEHHDPAFGAAPESYWTDHVTLESPQSPDGTWHDGAWTVTTQTTADVQVKVLARAPAQINAILDSARTIAVDAAGCAVSSPIQNPRNLRPETFDVMAVDSVDAVSVCQYDRTVSASQPGLMTSQLITGPTAAAYLEAAKAATTGGGPDGAEDCAGQEDGGTGIVVRLRSRASSHDLYVYYDWCRGNGVDDGTHLRTLTRGTCAALFAQPPVTLWQFQEALLPVCARGQRR